MEPESGYTLRDFKYSLRMLYLFLCHISKLTTAGRHIAAVLTLPPRRIRQVVSILWRDPSGPVHQPAHLPPALKITARISPAQVPQSRLSRFGDTVRREHLPQAQLVGGQLLTTVDAEGVAQDGTVLGAQRAEQRLQEFQTYLPVDDLLGGRSLPAGQKPLQRVCLLYTSDAADE